MENCTFGEIENCDYNSSDIVVLPLCYEKNVSYGKGTVNGPFHILNASFQLEALDEETLFDWSSLKIHTKEPFFPDSDHPEKAVKDMEEKALEVLEAGKFLISFGGDHAITIGPALAASKVYKNIGLVQIDAHLDLRDEWNGSRYNHACVIRRVSEETKMPVVQVGIRSVAPEEVKSMKEAENIKQFFAHNIEPFDYSWIDGVIDFLPENVYLSIDLDGLDPSVIPGTGTPEPGGLSYRQLVLLIKKLAEKRNIVAADICELSKIEGQQVSEFTAAKIAAKIFTFKHIFR